MTETEEQEKEVLELMHETLQTMKAYQPDPNRSEYGKAYALSIFEMEKVLAYFTKFVVER